MSLYKIYVSDDYKGEFNLLLNEKELILCALIETSGNINKALQLLCPEKKPYYNHNTLHIQIIKHSISTINMGEQLNRIAKIKKARKQERDKVSSSKVQKNLRELSKNNKNLKLRSLQT